MSFVEGFPGQRTGARGERGCFEKLDVLTFRVKGCTIVQAASQCCLAANPALQGLAAIFRFGRHVNVRCISSSTEMRPCRLRPPACHSSPHPVRSMSRSPGPRPDARSSLGNKVWPIWNTTPPSFR